MLDTYEIAGRLLAAAIAGAVIGWEREANRKPAGLRTHMLVALGAAAFMLAGVQLHQEILLANADAGSDIFKVLGGIAGGVGFLGAGSIIRAGHGVSGLTTAATIWLAAAIGVGCALRLTALVTSCVLLALGILVLLGVLERTLLFRIASMPLSGSSPSKSDAQEGET